MQGRDPRFGQQPYHPPPAHQGGHAGYAPHPQQAPAPAPNAGGWGANLGGGLGGIGGLGGLGGQLGGKIAMPAALGKVSGLPAPLSFVLGIAAVAVALVFDVIFLKVSIPGVGGYAWYLTTALSFAGAGYGSIKLTRASKTVAMAAVGVAAALYGIADLGLGMVLEDLPMSGAIILGAQGVGIAIFTGFGGVFKAMRERE